MIVEFLKCNTFSSTTTRIFLNLVVCKYCIDTEECQLVSDDFLNWLALVQLFRDFICISKVKQNYAKT
jgi:hypothetical protein